MRRAHSKRRAKSVSWSAEAVMQVRRAQEWVRGMVQGPIRARDSHAVYFTCSLIIY